MGIGTLNFAWYIGYDYFEGYRILNFTSLGGGGGGGVRGSGYFFFFFFFFFFLIF